MFGGGNNIFDYDDIDAYADESGSEDAAPEAVARGAAKGKAKVVRGPKVVRPWTVVSEGLSEAAHDTFMKGVGIKHFGHLDWLNRTDSAWQYCKLSNKYRRIAWCGFKNDCICGWRVEESYELDDVTNKCLFSVRVDETLGHADHTKSRQTSGVPKIVQLVLSQNTLAKGMHGCIERLRTEGFAWFVSEANQVKLASFRARFNSKRRHAKLSSDDSSKKNSFGRLATYVSKREKHVLQEKGLFNKHAAYVIDGWEVNQTTGHVRTASAHLSALTNPPPLTTRFCFLVAQVRIALLTENLALNAYRQQAAGSTTYLALDFTYRVYREGHGIMPFITMSPDQKGHIIAYAVSDSENAEAHEELLLAVKNEVERITRSKSGEPGV